MPSYLSLQKSLATHKRAFDRSSKIFLAATLLFIAVTSLWPVGLAAYLTITLGGMALSLLLKLLSDPPTNKTRALFYLSGAILGLAIGAWLLMSMPAAGLVVAGVLTAWKLLALPSLGFMLFCTTGYSAASNYLKRPQSKLSEDALTSRVKALHLVLASVFFLLAIGFILLSAQVFPLSAIMPVGFGLIVSTLSVSFIGWLLTDIAESEPTQAKPLTANKGPLPEVTATRRSASMTPLNEQPAATAILETNTAPTDVQTRHTSPHPVF